MNKQEVHELIRQATETVVSRLLPQIDTLRKTTNDLNQRLAASQASVQNLEKELNAVRGDVGRLKTESLTATEDLYKNYVQRTEFNGRGGWQSTSVPGDTTGQGHSFHAPAQTRTVGVSSSSVEDYQASLMGLTPGPGRSGHEMSAAAMARQQQMDAARARMGRG